MTILVLSRMACRLIGQIRGFPGWKPLQNGTYSPLELHHLARDPGEIEEMSKVAPQVFNERKNALCGHIQRAGGVPWQRPQRCICAVRRSAPATFCP